MLTLCRGWIRAIHHLNHALRPLVVYRWCAGPLFKFHHLWMASAWELEPASPEPPQIRRASETHSPPLCLWPEQTASLVFPVQHTEMKQGSTDYKTMAYHTSCCCFYLINSSEVIILTEQKVLGSLFLKPWFCTYWRYKALLLLPLKLMKVFPVT